MKVRGRVLREVESLCCGWNLEGVNDFYKYGHNPKVKGLEDLEIWQWDVLAVGSQGWYLSRYKCV